MENFLLKTKLDSSDIYFSIFILCLFFLSFANSGSSIENNIQGIFTLIFSIPVLTINYKKINGSIKNILGVSLIITMIFSTWNYFGFSNFNSWLRVINLIALIFFAKSSCIFFKNNQERIKYLLFVFPIIAIIHIFLIVEKWTILDNPYAYDWVYKIGFFGNIRYVAILTSIGLICNIYLMLKENNFKRLLFLLSSILIMSFIFWSGTRSVFMSILLISLYFIYSSTDKLLDTLTIFILMVTSILISMHFPVAQTSLGLERITHTSTSGRIDIWIDTIHYIMHKPLIGYGAESFGVVHSFYNGSGSHLVQAHNMILQILIEFGIIGLTIISILIFLQIKKIELTNRAFNEQSLFIAIIFNYLSIGLVDGIAYYSFSIYFLILVFALLDIHIKRN